MSYSKGTLRAYRKINTKDIHARNIYLTGSAKLGGQLVVTGSASVGGNLTVTGSIVTRTNLSVTGSADVNGQFTASGITVTGSISGSSYVGALGDMQKSVYDTDSDDVVDDSEKLEGLTAAQVRTHAPASHGSSHTSGSGDKVTIYKNQISDIDNLVLTAPRLSITGSAISNISGSLTVTGSISGSSYEGPLVESVRKSGSSSLIGDVVLTGSGYVYITQSGQIIEISGSQAAAGVSSIGKSGSTLLTGDVYLTGSSNLDLTQSGQVIDFTLASTISPTSVIATNITGSTLVSGSDIRGPTALITNITSTNITGSTLVSGSDFRGPTATITAITSTNITGSQESLSGKLYVADEISGSSHGYFASNVKLGGNLTAEGQSTVSGLTATGSISGSTLQGELQSTRVLLTGSTHLSDWRHATDQRYLDGTDITGSIDANARVTIRKNSGGTGYVRRRINLIEGTGISLTLGDDITNEEVDVQLSSTARTGTGSTGPYSFMVYSGSGAGGPYFAEDPYGNTKYSGSDAATVISGSVWGLGTQGGTVFIKGGAIYSVGQTITIPTQKSVILQGEGMGVDGVSVSATTLKASTSLNKFIDAEEAISRIYLSLRDLSIDGNDTTTIGVAIERNFRKETMRNVRICNCTTGIKLNHCWILDFCNIQINNCTTGVHFAGGTTGVLAVNFWGGAVEACETRSILFEGNVINNKIIGVTIEGNDNSYGIEFLRTSLGVPSANIIDKCYFENLKSGAIDIYSSGSYDPGYKAGPSRNQVIRNIFHSTSGKQIINLTEGYHWIIKDNSIKTAAGTVYLGPSTGFHYVTSNTIEGFHGQNLIIDDQSTAKQYIRNNEKANYFVKNSGTSTGTGAQQTIAHGLSVTPNRVFLSDIEEGANAYQSASADDTNIYITAVSGKDYAWSVWKHPYVR